MIIGFKSQIAAIVLVLGLTVANAEATTLKFATMGPEKLQFIQCGHIQFLNQLTKKSGGKLNFQTFFAGTAFAHPLKQYDQLVRGIIDMSFGVLTYLPGRFPMTNIGTLPFMMNESGAGARAMTRVYQKHLRKEFSDIHLLAIALPPLYQVQSRKKIASIGDFKGLRIRAAGRIHGQILKALGAVPAQIPAPGLYENLAKGVVDGALFPWSGLVSWKLGEVTKYSLGLNLNASTLFHGMSNKAYDGLPADLKRIIDNSAGVPLVDHISSCWRPITKKGKAIASQKGRTVTIADDKLVSQIKAKLAPITEKYLAGLEAKGLPARKVHAAIKKAVKEEEAK